MLEKLPKISEQLSIVRLAAVDKSTVNALLELGVSPAGFSEIIPRMKSVGSITEAAQIVEGNFAPSVNPDHATPFRPTRFTDGVKAVFYSALQDETAIAEVGYWQAQETGTLKGHPKYFSMYGFEFDGFTVDLDAFRNKCPELTSKDSSGYPRCREIADEARGQYLDALRTPSARHVTGTCVPVFTKGCLNVAPLLKYRGRYMVEGDTARFERLD